ncbi:MAG: FAD-dependent oxidoreductase [Terricaulis sp.]
MKRVVIVGAGIVGLWCAVRLAKAGARVTLVEAEGVDVSLWGPGASAAAAGLLAPLDHQPSAHDGLAFQSLDLWRAGQAGAEWADGVRFDGGIIVAENSEQASALSARAGKLGRHTSPLSGSQFRKRTGFDAKLEHALFVEDEAIADPIRVMGGLYMQARAHGVALAYGRDASEVTPRRVTTYEGDVYEADAVVLAPGIWASEDLKLAAPALGHLRPAKGHLVPVALPTSFRANVRASGFYFARRLQDCVLGATLEFDAFTRAVDPTRVAEMEAAAGNLLPGQVQTVGQAWTGIRPMSPDGWPMIGDGGAGVWIAAGHSRNGWLLAPLTGEIVTAYVFGQTIPPEWAALSPQRFGSP